MQIHSIRPTLFIAFTCSFSVIAPAFAQESQTSPPPALQFPYEASPTTQRGVALIFLRGAIESAADTALCNALMQNDGKPVPTPFEKKDCLPAYAAKVKANEGAVHWASNSRPLKCGESCFGRPFMTAEQNLNKPNLRRAQIFGWLNFVLDGPATLNRSLSYPYRIFLTCKADNGARNGILNLKAEFDPPVIGSAGVLETILSEAFSLGEISRYIDNEIKKSAPGIPSLTVDQDPCLSVGVDRSGDPKFDIVRYDPVSGSGPRTPAFETAVTSALRDSVQVELLSIKRNPLPLIVDPSHGHPGDPFAAQFRLYFNGEARFLPSGGLSIPPEGGTAAAHFCKTVDVTGHDRLQLVFANDLGGGAWSEFPRSAKFGDGGLHTITTGRTIVLPASQGPVDPRTGRPTLIKPQPFQLREFELTYRLTYVPAPTVSAGAADAGPAGGTSSGGASTRPPVSSRLGAAAGRVTGSIAIDPSKPPPTPCVAL